MLFRSGSIARGGTKKKPVAVGVKFNYTIRTDDGNLSNPVKTYKIHLQGLKSNPAAVAGGKYRAWHRLDTTSDPVLEDHTFGILFLDSAWLIKIRIEKEGFPEPLDEEGQAEVIGRILASFKTDLD